MRRADRRVNPDSPPVPRARFRAYRVPRWGVAIVLLLAGFVAARGFGLDGTAIQPVSGDVRPRAARVSGHTVVVDAGHGGVDPGAVGKDGLQEKAVTLPIAQKLETLLNRSAVYTVMVRKGDEDLADPGLRGFSKRKRQDIERRVRLANAAGADAYVSIHANSFPGGPWKGAQTFYAADDPDGKELARAIQASLVERLGPNNRRPKAGDFAVLNKTEMPAVIVEVGFLSHPEEARNLSDPQYQGRVAEAIYEGILQYWTAQDGPPSPGPDDGAAPGSSAPDAEPSLSAASDLPGRAWIFVVGTDEAGAPALVPVDRPLLGARRDAGAAVVATAAVDALIHFAERAGEGTLASPVPEGTRVLRLEVDEGTARVDFSRELRTARLRGVTSEVLLVYAIVNTLTAVDGIDRVAFTVEGEAVRTLGGHLFLDEPLEWNPAWIAQDPSG